MLFYEAMETVVKLAEQEIGNHIDPRGENAIIIVKSWMAGDAPLKIQTERRKSLTVIFQSNGDIEIAGVSAEEIVIDDRRTS